jgi:hypothetical protein
MGKVYKNGRLYANEGFNVTGTRTLAAATESDLWSGTTATRPIPSAQQIRVISTSTEDDSVKTQSGTITIAGTMDPALTDEWDCTVAGTVDNWDVARLALDGVNYDTMVSPAIPNIAALVAAIADAAMLGTFDTWVVTIGAVGLDAGDVVQLVVPGAAASPYSYTVQLADTAAMVATGLKGQVDADAGKTYSAAIVGSSVIMIKNARGPGVAVSASWTTDTNADATVSSIHSITGVAGQTAWNVTDDGITQVNCLRAVAGATAGTVATSFFVDTGGASTFTAVHTITGADADVLSVDDGTNTFSRTVLTAVLNDEVAALAATINASAAYIATALAGVITVTAAVPGVGFTFVDASTDNQTADLTVTIDNTANMANGAGTGLQTLRVDYLNASGLAQSETITMNGTTQVLSVATDVDAIQAITATSVGTNKGAVGTISVTNVGNTSTFETIPVGACASASADYTVPVARKAFIMRVAASAGAVATTVKLCSDVNPATGAIVANGKFVWATGIFGTQPEDLEPVVPYGPFPAGARIWLTGLSAGGTACQGNLEGYNVDASAVV